MSNLCDILYSHATETTYVCINKTSEFLLHLDCLDPVENEQWASWPFLPNATGNILYTSKMVVTNVFC